MDMIKIREHLHALDRAIAAKDWVRVTRFAMEVQRIAAKMYEQAKQKIVDDVMKGK